MAAQAVKLGVQSSLEPVVLEEREAHVPRSAHGRVFPLPIRTPLLHPRAVEALLLAFRPLGPDRDR